MPFYSHLKIAFGIVLLNIAEKTCRQLNATKNEQNWPHHEPHDCCTDIFALRNAQHVPVVNNNFIISESTMKDLEKMLFYKTKVRITAAWKIKSKDT
ncbi:hypothetical protein T4C_6645 [Trichinella pseudospiralis]|uniref:Uncharacterized protein n=1 Tax=Trichinella pseudospiralis TaxID=6337 RepID=A0A0V1K5G8_TRIPS|nr:hypothetical protein T4C_6645 [Trichinella pseudospiralis]